MEIRDTRNGDWHWVYNALLADQHLTAGEKLVYSSISTFGGHQIIHPTKEQLAERCGLDAKTVQRSLNKLEKVGYLRVERSVGRGNANVYFLLKKPKGCNLCPFIKGDIYNHKRGHLEQEKGTETTPYIDKIDKIDILGEIVISPDVSGKEKPLKLDRRAEPKLSIFRLFGGKQPWWFHKQEREAALRLFDMRGVEKVRRGLEIMLENGDDTFCPQAGTPFEYEKQLPKLNRYIKRNGIEI